MLMATGLTIMAITSTDIITGIPTGTITTGIIMAKVAIAMSTEPLTLKLLPRSRGFGR